MDLVEQGVQLVPADGFQLLELLALGLLAPVMQDDARNDQDRAQDHAEEQHAGEVAEETGLVLLQVVLRAPLALIEVEEAGGQDGHDAGEDHVIADVDEVAQVQLGLGVQGIELGVIQVPALVDPLADDVGDEAAEDHHEAGDEVIRAVDVDDEEAHDDDADGHDPEAALAAGHDGEAHLPALGQGIILAELEDAGDHHDVEVHLNGVGGHDQGGEVKLAGDDGEDGQQDDGHGGNAALVDLLEDGGEHVVVRHDEEGAGTVCDVRAEDGAVGDDGDNHEEHARPAADMLDEDIRVAHGAAALLGGPGAPAADGGESAQGGQDVGQGDDGLGDPHGLGNDLGVRHLTGHVGHALVAHVHPDDDGDAVADGGEEALFLIEDGLKGVELPVAEAHDGHGGEGRHHQDGEEGLHLFQPVQADDVDDGEDDDHGNFHGEGRGGAQLDELGGVAGHQSAVLCLAEPGGQSGPEAHLPAPELAEGLAAPGVDAALGGQQGAELGHHLTHGDAPDEGEDHEQGQGDARAAGGDGFLDTEGARRHEGEDDGDHADG